MTWKLINMITDSIIQSRTFDLNVENRYLAVSSNLFDQVVFDQIVFNSKVLIKWFWWNCFQSNGFRSNAFRSNSIPSIRWSSLRKMIAAQEVLNLQSDWLTNRQTDRQTERSVKFAIRFLRKIILFFILCKSR